MTLESLRNLGDFIGGIGVVATLIYLAFQVRQNTAALRTARRQAIVAGMRDHVRLALQPGGDSFLHSVEAFPDVSPDEYRFCTTRMNDLLLFFQGAFALHEKRQLDLQTCEDYLIWFACQVTTPGGTVLWKESSPVAIKSAAAAVNGRLERAELPDILQFSSHRIEAKE